MNFLHCHNFVSSKHINLLDYMIICISGAHESFPSWLTKVSTTKSAPDLGNNAISKRCNNKIMFIGKSAYEMMWTLDLKILKKKSEHEEMRNFVTQRYTYRISRSSNQKRMKLKINKILLTFSRV